VVASILRLRLSITIHQLRREWWRILVLIGAAVWTLSLLPSVAYAALDLSFRAPDVRMDAYTAIVAVLVVGWMTVPILIAGLDDSLDPARFASLGVPAKRIMPGLTVSAFLTIPVLFFFTTLIVFSTSWLPDGGEVFAVALAGAMLTLATIVLSARVSVMWTARLLQSRRSREAAFLSGIVGVFLIAPLASILIADGLETILEYDARPILESLRLTPVAAPVGAAGAASMGDWGGVLWRLAISTAWVVMLWLVWRINVAHVLVHPTARGGGARARDDSVLATVVRFERRWAKTWRRLHRTRGEPSHAAVAVWARAVRYWFSDPRYLATILSVAVFPILFFFLVYPAFVESRRDDLVAIIVGVPILLAGTIGWGRHNDVAYDSTALWLDVSSGRLGRAIMWGRTTAVLVWAIPMVAVGIVAAIAVSGRPDLAPGVIGACAGVLGTSLGVSAVTSVVLPYRAPAPGENPFSAQLGSVGASLFAQAISSGVSWIVAAPVVLPLVAALLWNPLWGWVGLVTGIGTGALALIVGIRWAGSLYDRRSGRLVGAVA
jgi:ABC-2 type transport system permease protein